MTNQAPGSLVRPPAPSTPPRLAPLLRLARGQSHILSTDGVGGRRGKQLLKQGPECALISPGEERLAEPVPNITEITGFGGVGPSGKRPFRGVPPFFRARETRRFSGTASDGGGFPGGEPARASPTTTTRPVPTAGRQRSVLLAVGVQNATEPEGAVGGNSALPDLVRH